MEYYGILRERGFEFEDSAETYQGGGYIFTDGKLLSLNKNARLYKETGSKRVTVHPEFDRYLNQIHRFGRAVARILVYTDDRAIAINDGLVIHWERPYIELTRYEPTEEQYTSLLGFIDRVANSVKKVLDVSRPTFANEKPVLQHFDLTKDLPEDVIKYIKSLYKDEY